MKVTQMTSPRTGRPVANQFILTGKDSDGYDCEIFQSYATIIAKIRHLPGQNMQVILDADMWDCSVTTGKYRNHFLRESIADTRKKIAAGIYTLDDLN